MAFFLSFNIILCIFGIVLWKQMSFRYLQLLNFRICGGMSYLKSDIQLHRKDHPYLQLLCYHLPPLVSIVWRILQVSIFLAIKKSYCLVFKSFIFDFTDQKVAEPQTLADLLLRRKQHRSSFGFLKTKSLGDKETAKSEQQIGPSVITIMMEPKTDCGVENGSVFVCRHTLMQTEVLEDGW